MWRVVLAGMMAAVLGASAVSARRQAAGVSKDLKGWQDVAWGATPEQVSASIGVSLGPPKKGEDGRTYFRVQDYPVGAWTTNLVAIFSGSDRLGLSSVTLNFRKDTKFEPVVSELTSRYGPPTSTKSEKLSDNRTQVLEASWLFPSTEVTCRWRGPWGIVVYQPRSAGRRP